MDKLSHVQEQKKSHIGHPLNSDRKDFAKIDFDHPLYSPIFEMQKAYGNRYVQKLFSGKKSPCPELCGINEPLVDIPTRQTAQFKPHSCDSCFFHPKRPIKHTSVGTSDSSNGHSIQTKLIVGQPGDVYEQEADRVAEAVLQRQCTSPECEKDEAIQRVNITPIIRRQDNSEEEEEETGSIQAKKAGVKKEYTAIEDILEQKGSGKPLDHMTKGSMETRFRHNFGDVRIHTDSYAAEKSEELSAEAFTIGRDIFFRMGKYNPSSLEGKRLLAHELTHVVQQNGNNISVNFWNGDDHKALTYKAAKGVMDDDLFIYQIASHSSIMDYKGKRLLWTGPQFLLGITKGEGPEHGEDGNYSHLSESSAASQNINLQNKYLNIALEHQKTFKSMTLSDIPVRKLGDVASKIFSALGDACHIAQDRGSHWEGVKGRGHDDPRARNNWDPDDPADNSTGYDKALKNTRQLFEAWVTKKREIDEKSK
jgi:hypothetical protein